jgi:ABC-type antimicrobial peptide transport system, ATPase component
MLITIQAGYNKSNLPETFDSISLESGKIYSIVGNTGSGKSRLIKDIEQLTSGDSLSKRHILLNHKVVPLADKNAISTTLISHLSQNMRFVLDTSVHDFLTLHAHCRKKVTMNLAEVLSLANTITPEPIIATQNLNTLSGGQSRALMIADIACICDSSIVLIDEIENAGINKMQALKVLLNTQKLVLIVTHDPHTALMADTRIIMENGGIKSVLHRTQRELSLYETLTRQYEEELALQMALRKGESLT